MTSKNNKNQPVQPPQNAIMKLQLLGIWRRQPVFAEATLLNLTVSSNMSIPAMTPLAAMFDSHKMQSEHFHSVKYECEKHHL